MEGEEDPCSLVRGAVTGTEALPRGLYGMLDVPYDEPERDTLDRALFLTDRGVQAIQLRAKHLDLDGIAGLAERLVRTVPLLIVNDHVPLAAALGVWAHVGQEDGPDPGVPFGRSTHTTAQVERPGAATYVGYGPVFGSTTKATGYAARGVDGLRAAVLASRIPVVAIGGITAENIDAVRATGVHAWAPISGFWSIRADRAALDRLTRQ